MVLGQLARRDRQRGRERRSDGGSTFKGKRVKLTIGKEVLCCKGHFDGESFVLEGDEL